MLKKAIFPGSFDPFTKGHEDIVRRLIPLFDEIVIAIGSHAEKKKYFQEEQMLQHISALFKNESKVRVKIYQGLTVHLAKKEQAQYLIRGLRNTIDFEYESAIAKANQSLYPELETLFITTKPEYSYISSSIVRDIHKNGGNVNEYLPYVI